MTLASKCRALARAERSLPGSAREQHDAPQHYWAGKSHHARRFPPRLPWPPGRCQEGDEAHTAKRAPQALLALVLALTVLSEGQPCHTQQDRWRGSGGHRKAPAPASPFLGPLASASGTAGREPPSRQLASKLLSVPQARTSGGPRTPSL